MRWCPRVSCHHVSLCLTAVLRGSATSICVNLGRFLRTSLIRLTPTRPGSSAWSTSSSPGSQVRMYTLLLNASSHCSRVSLRPLYRILHPAASEEVCVVVIMMLMWCVCLYCPTDALSRCVDDGASPAERTLACLPLYLNLLHLHKVLGR